MRVFKSKVGYELLIPITLIFAAIPIWAVVDGAPVEAIVTLSLILIATYAFVLYVLLGITYVITDDGYLIAKSRFVKYEPVAIDSITRIVKTQNPISAPASSLDRIEIFYSEHCSIIISPKDKIGLVDALKKINPSILYHPK